MLFPRLFLVVIFTMVFPDNDVYEKIVFQIKILIIILFLGDQIYEATGVLVKKRDRRYGRPMSWIIYENGMDVRLVLYRELFRHKPCAIIPEYHCIYHGNVGARVEKKPIQVKDMELLAGFSGV